MQMFSDTKEKKISLRKKMLYCGLTYLCTWLDRPYIRLHKDKRYQKAQNSFLLKCSKCTGRLLSSCSPKKPVQEREKNSSYQSFVSVMTTTYSSRFACLTDCEWNDILVFKWFLEYQQWIMHHQSDTVSRTAHALCQWRLCTLLGNTIQLLKWQLLGSGEAKTSLLNFVTLVLRYSGLRSYAG